MAFGSLYELAWTVAAIVAFGAAILAGGVARRAGGVVAVGWALSMAIDGYDWGLERVLLFGIDLSIAVYLVWLTRTRRPAWLIFTAACATLLVVNYGVYVLLPQVREWAFLSVSHLWSAAILVGLIWGAIATWRQGHAA